jgi:hypothetical protein
MNTQQLIDTARALVDGYNGFLVIGENAAC